MRRALLVVVLGVSSAAAAIVACVATPDVSGLPPPADAGPITIVDGNVPPVDTGLPVVDAGPSDSAPDVVTVQDTGTDAPVTFGCGALDLSGAQLVAVSPVKGNPPPMDGGDIAQGLYLLSAATAFSADGGASSGIFPRRAGLTYVDAAVVIDTQEFVDGGPGDGGPTAESISGQTITAVDGGTITYNGSCGVLGVGSTETFTATPTTLYIAHPFDGGVVVDKYDVQ
jgi:hypothetical protein